MQAGIEPVLLPFNAPLAQIRDNLNAGVLRTANLGELTLIGQGAGGPPTAHAVLTDLLEILNDHPVSPLMLQETNLCENPEAVRYYIGTQAETAGLFVELIQEIRRSGGRTQLWTVPTANNRLKALIAQARAQDPQLFAARIEEEAR